MSPVRSLTRDKIASPKDLGGATSNGMSKENNPLSNKPNIIFFGTTDFAVPALTKLIINEYLVSAVFTGKGSVAGIAKQYGLKIFQPASLRKNEAVLTEFKSLSPDLCILTAYGKIIPDEFLAVPAYGFLNIHPSLLPKHRGPSPIQTAIFNGERETGVSLMLIDKEIDHGPVLAQESYPLKTNTTYKKAEQDLAEKGSELLLKILPEYIAGNIKLNPQDHSQATFTKMFHREDGKIDWSLPADTISQQIRALNPEPGAWTTWKGKTMNIPTCDIVSPQIINGNDVSDEKYGEVRSFENNIVIQTGKGYLVLRKIQLEGGKIMDVKSFLNGHPGFLNSKLI